MLCAWRLAVLLCTASPPPNVAVCVCAKPVGPFADTAISTLLVPSLERTVLQFERRVFNVSLYVGVDATDSGYAEWIRTTLAVPAWLSVVVRTFPPTGRIPFNEITHAAWAAGADYIVRVNDDTEFVTRMWLSQGVGALRRHTPSNVGVVGPTCNEGTTAIMTHDMVHKTHMEIFNGTYYPVAFNNWFVDDWITKVYAPGRSHQLKTWVVKHHIGKHGTRYTPVMHADHKVNTAVKKGAAQIARWVANPPFTITILTMNRARSLQRLLTSISTANYNGERVNVVIKVDKSDGNEGVLRVARAFYFKHGTVSIAVSQTQMGLRGAWFNAWAPPSPRHHGIILEDDVELCHDWYLWITRAWQSYGHRKDIAGISLQRQTWIMQAPASRDFMAPESVPFLYKLLGTIGFSPHPQRWLEFMSWIDTISLETFDPTRLNSLPLLETSKWFQKLKPSGWWEAWFIYKCELESLYTLYMFPPNKRSLALHWSEKGEHSGGSTGPGGTLFTGQVSVFPATLDKYGWDGKREQPDLLTKITAYAQSIGKTEQDAGNMVKQQILDYSKIGGVVHNICETGFFKGVSAYMWLESYPLATLNTFDLAFDPRSKTTLLEKYGKMRLNTIRGDSSKTAVSYAGDCDILSIDGNHGGWGPYDDLVALLPNTKCGAAILFDDTFDRHKLYKAGAPINNNPKIHDAFYNDCSRSYWRAVAENKISHVNCVNFGKIVSSEIYPKGYCRGIKQCQSTVCLKSPTVPYGQTGNRILQVANALSGGRTVALDPPLMTWFQDWFEEHSRIVLLTAHTQCGQVLQTYDDYQRLHGSFNYHAVHPELPSLQLRKAHCAAALQRYGSKPFTSVHRRNLDGQCTARLRSKQTYCTGDVEFSDPAPCGWAGTQFDKSAVLFTDGQVPHLDATFQTADTSPFPVQMCAMTLSDTHYGNPGSSIDYIVSHWRTGRTLPKSCWGAQPDTVVTPGRTVILQFLNEGFLEMTKSWICNIKSISSELLAKIVFIATDDAAFRAIGAFNPTLTVVYKPYAAPPQMEYGQAAYFNYMLFRTKTIGEFLERNVTIWLTESDSVWVRDPSADVEGAPGELVTMSDRPPPTRALQGGFMLLRPTARVRALWRQATAQFAAIMQKVSAGDNIGDGGSEQIILDRMLRNPGAPTVTWLDPLKYVPGSWYSTQQRIQNATVILNNWIIGNDAKIKRAKDWGHWFLEGNRCRQRTP